MGDRAVFIDRDGTININSGYITCPDEFKMYPSVAKGIKLLQENGFKIIIISNQSGIAREYFSEKTLDEIHEKMKSELLKEHARVDKIYYCPHHPDEKCNCRKPNPGMLEKAICELDIDAVKSFMIGDRMLDVEAGYKIGCKTILVPENKEKVEKEMKLSQVMPNYICSNFYSAARWIFENDKNKNYTMLY